jgi:NADPH-dependent 2,4-dienoyl-CoA reductase/sulfur reductase-like enzyme
VQPEANTVTLGTGETIGYDYLIVATGLQSDWQKIPGLLEALEKGPSGGVCSNYRELVGLCGGGGGGRGEIFFMCRGGWVLGAGKGKCWVGSSIDATCLTDWTD